MSRSHDVQKGNQDSQPARFTHYEAKIQKLLDEQDRTAFFGVLIALVLLVVAFFATRYSLLWFNILPDSDTGIFLSLLNNIVVNLIPVTLLFTISYLFARRIVAAREAIRSEYQKHEMRSAIIESFHRDNTGIQRVFDKGITNIHNNLSASSNELVQRINQAQRCVRYLTFNMEDSLLFENALTSAAKNGAQIEILMINPASSLARERSKELGYTEDYFPNKIRTRIEEFQTVAAQQNISIKVRIYDTIPSLYLCICDDYALMGFYWNKSRATQNFLIEVHGVPYTDIGKKLEDEFLAIWASAKDPASGGDKAMINKKNKSND